MRLFWHASMGNGRTVVLHRFGVLVEGGTEALYLPANPMFGGRQLPATLAANDKLRVGTSLTDLRQQLVMSYHGGQDVPLVAFFEDGGGTKYRGTALIANAATRDLQLDDDVPGAPAAQRPAVR